MPAFNCSPLPAPQPHDPIASRGDALVAAPASPKVDIDVFARLGLYAFMVESPLTRCRRTMASLFFLDPERLAQSSHGRPAGPGRNPGVSRARHRHLHECRPSDQLRQILARSRPHNHRVEHHRQGADDAPPLAQRRRSIFSLERFSDMPYRPPHRRRERLRPLHDSARALAFTRRFSSRCSPAWSSIAGYSTS